jgi:AmmeMemoRadiSam system protein A
MLLETEKKFLLKEARDAIISAVLRSKVQLHRPPSKALAELRGAFVTLHIGDNLRGCIGYADALYPLAETVRVCAAKAAMDDVRFQPLTRRELQSVSIEISVLSEMTPVSDYHEIITGKHGLMLQTESRRGLLLPQVAVEHGWDSLTFLGHVALKAGLPSDGWKLKNVKLFTFTADVFREEHINQDA